MIAAGMAFHSLLRATICLLSLLYFIPVVIGHARLIYPPSRATMWRFGFDYNEPDYNDNQGFCGGAGVLHNTFKGKCGVCGDPWLPLPREHERGGKFYTGEVTAYFDAGSIITTEVQVTANHKGFFEFRICPYDKPENGDLEMHKNGTMIEVDQSCLDKHILQLANGQGTKYYLPTNSGMGFFKVTLKLPADLICKKCLFQWRYKTGNSWGVDPIGKGCVGCGEQEEFKACADIVIEPFQTGTKPTHSPPKLTEGFDRVFNLNPDKNQWKTTDKPWHLTTASNDITTTTNGITTTTSDITTTTNDITTTSDNQKEVSTKPLKVTTKTTQEGCRPTQIYAQVPGMTNWCNINCSRGFCPASHCLCNTS